MRRPPVASMTYPVNRTAKAAFILFSVAIFGCTVPVENKAANKGASATKVLSTASTAKSSPVAEKKKDVSPPAKRRAAARPPARASAAQSRSASIGPSRNALPPSDGGFSDELRLYRQDRRTYEEDRSLYERDRRDYEDALRNQP